MTLDQLNEGKIIHGDIINVEMIISRMNENTVIVFNRHSDSEMTLNKSNNDFMKEALEKRLEQLNEKLKAL